MRRALLPAVCAAFALLTLPTAAVGAPEEDGADLPQPPAQLDIGAVDVTGHPEVSLTLGVTAHPGGPLPTDAFTLFEDGEQRDIEVTAADNADLQVLLLIDTTGSMGGPSIANARSAATAFVEQMPAGIPLAVLGYAAEATVMTGFSASRDEHITGIDGLVADGTTAMYDAVVTATELFEADGDVTRMIVLLTDGEDNASGRTIDDATEALRRADVVLHSVEYLTAYNEGQGIRSMARATGGAVRRADDADALIAAYEQLAADLVSRYELAYTSQSNGTTDLELLVDHDGLQASDRRTVTLPDATDEPDGAPDEAVPVTPPVVTEPPLIPPDGAPSLGRAALIGGAALWFVALVIAAMVSLTPRRRRAQIAGMSVGSVRGRAGMTAIASRATNLAERGLERQGYRRGLNGALERAGIDLRPGEFVVLVGCLVVTAAAVGRLLHGWSMALLLALTALILARFLVVFLIRRRQARFADQLGETLQLLAGSLRAGYSLMQAIDSVAREASSPAADEFGRLVIETRLGRDTGDALRAMSERMESEDFSWVMQAIEIHREVGGDLADVLNTVAATIRERNQIRRQVKALSAEGKLSAYVLISLPVAVGGFIALTNPSYLAELPNGGPLGWVLIVTGVVLLAAGIVWMRNLVRFRF